ncbi:MAG TPA: hypothetical protein VN457_08020 [Chlamydiales bacterium]|nr:hypothetical protein [Chlamydiales bacterium]
MDVYISDRAYEITPGEHERIGQGRAIEEIVRYVVRLLGSLYELQEIDQAAAEIYLAHCYYYSTLHGHLHFFKRIQFDNTIVQMTVNALGNMKAYEHQMLLQRAFQLMPALQQYRALSDEAYEALLADLAPVDKAFHALIDEALMQKKKTLLDLQYDHISLIKNIRIMPEEEVTKAMKRLAAAVPKKEEKLKKRAEQDAKEAGEYARFAQMLCAKCHLQFISIDDKRSDVFLELFGDEVLCYEISTDDGEYDVVCDDRTLFLLRLGRVKATMPCSIVA